VDGGAPRPRFRRNRKAPLSHQEVIPTGECPCTNGDGKCMTTDLAHQKDFAASSGLSQTPRLLSDLTMPSERLALVKDGDRWMRARLPAEAVRLAGSRAPASERDRQQR
jgi:hypothetical protein